VLLLSCLPPWLTPPLAAPIIQTLQRGCVVSSSISIAQCLQGQLVEDAFDGDDTDHSWSDAGEDQEGAPAGASQNHRRTSGVRALYIRARRQNRRQLKKSGVQKGTDTGLKPHVLKHRGRAARAAAFLVDFCIISDAEVTVPGWVGKTLELPQHAYSFDELCAEYSLTPFAWDGRYATLPPPFPLTLPAHFLAEQATFF
jgi:hypothetical protein